MPDLPPASESDDAPTPRWVKVLGIAAVIFALAFAALHLAGRGLGHHMAGHEPPSHEPKQP